MTTETKKRIYNQLLFKLHYCTEDLPTFETQAEVDDFYKALGRMVHYAMQGRDSTQDEVRIVNASLGVNPLEICAAYYAPLNAAVMGDDGYPRYYLGATGKLDAALDPLMAESKDIYRPFVMAAVKHESDGKFGFHS